MSDRMKEFLASQGVSEEVVTGEVVLTKAEEAKVVKTVVPKQIRAVEFPENGFTLKFQRKILPWVEQFWHANKRYPSNADFAQKYGFTLEQIQTINSDKLWNQSLKRRGIRSPNIAADFISDRQIAAIATVTNFHDVRTPVAKLAALGISEEEYNGWMQDPVFKNAVRERTDDILDNASIDADIQLAMLIKKGNLQAIKYHGEITGRNQTPEMVNVKQTIQILIEAIQKHVDDPEVLQAIASEVNAIRGISSL